MGNKIGRKRQVVDEKYTRPQGLYQHRDIDYKKLRKLILESKLAPCYPGLEEFDLDLEECPICFLCYPSLNRSRCCMKGICTECFLQMKPPHLTRPTQCPFCKTSNYAVEYRGAKTKEEKGHEEVEEQKVIEAQIRIRQQELLDEAERMKKRQDISSSSMIMHPTDVQYQNMNSASISVPSLECTRQLNDYGLSQVSSAAQASTLPSDSRQNRDHNFDLDLEDIMIIEAIWLSIQEQGSDGNPGYAGNHLPGPSASGGWYNSHGSAPVRSSPSSGLACAAAALAERQHMNAGLTRHAAANRATCSASHRSGNSSVENVRYVQNNSPEQWIEISPDSGREVSSEEFRECLSDRWSEVADAGTSYAGSEDMAEPGLAPIPLQEGTTNMAPGGHFVPESFEEQMMLAMAVSLAEARSRTSDHGVSWL